MYIKQMGEYVLVEILYVDDFIILANNVTQLKWLKLELKNGFEISGLGELHYCLGMKFERNKEACTIIMN